MLRPLRRPLVVLLLAILVIGGNGAALQLAAWAGMLAARAPHEGWRAAVNSTFAGHRPCAMCRLAQTIAAGEQSVDGSDERTPPKPAPAVAKDAALLAEPLPLPVLGAGVAIRHVGQPPAARAATLSPPEPPPPRRG